MNLCFRIADRIHRRRARSAATRSRARVDDARAYWTWQYESSEAYFAHFFDLHDSLRGADVVDIGCGLGGRTCYLARQGVRRIVGTDINHAEIRQARELVSLLDDSDGRRQIRFEEVEENEALHDGPFDVALLVDSLEHVRDPRAVLDYAHGLLRPGGVCYFGTSGWYHHQAAHVGSIIPIPFATALFSDRQILDAVRTIVDQPYYQRTVWDSDPPSRRWRDCHSLHDRPGEHLNKYTIAAFRRAMRASAFAQWQLKVEGFSARRHPLLALCNVLARVPLIQELYHSAVFGRLTKELQ